MVVGEIFFTGSSFLTVFDDFDNVVFVEVVVDVVVVVLLLLVFFFFFFSGCGCCSDFTLDADLDDLGDIEDFVGSGFEEDRFRFFVNEDEVEDFFFFVVWLPLLPLLVVVLDVVIGGVVRVVELRGGVRTMVAL